MSRRKTYAIEERMSGDWIERWPGFTSLRHARSYARKAASQCHGQLRIVMVVRHAPDKNGRYWGQN